MEAANSYEEFGKKDGEPCFGLTDEMNLEKLLLAFDEGVEQLHDSTAGGTGTGMTLEDLIKGQNYLMHFVVQLLRIIGTTSNSLALRPQEAKADVHRNFMCEVMPRSRVM